MEGIKKEERGKWRARMGRGGGGREDVCREKISGFPGILPRGRDGSPIGQIFRFLALNYPKSTWGAPPSPLGGGLLITIQKDRLAW